MMEGIIQLTELQKQLIEKLSVMHEKSGLQPAPAKILALLIVSNNPELTFDEIRLTLNISKSATSNALNSLMALDKIVYLSKFGERKRYFSSKITSWEEDIKSQFSNLPQISSLFQEILDQRPAESKEFNASLKKIISFLHYLGHEIPVMYAKWERQNK